MKYQLRPKLAIAIFTFLSTAPLYAVDSNPNRDVYFGTTHGHSNWSIDAFGLGNQSAGPEDGYRFARGEAVSHMGGEKVKLVQPLEYETPADRFSACVA